jgi:outer membrane protein OmpA-like peptidoglycan-associated protein
MTIRSILFATVAFPMLTISVAVQPALADRLMKPFEVAQEGGISQDGGEQVPEQLLRKKRKQGAEQSQEEPAAEDGQPSRAEPRKRQRPEQQQEAQPPEAEQPSRAERNKRQRPEQQQQEEIQPSGQNDVGEAADEKAKARAERKKSQNADQKQQDDLRPATDDAAAKTTKERATARPQRHKRHDTEGQQQEDAQPSSEDEAAQKAAEENRRIGAEQKVRAKQEEDGKQPVAKDNRRPAIDGNATETRPKPMPGIVDTRSTEEKQKIARNPAASDDTIVLPIDNGAAVLDSDKDSDNADGNVRETRRKQRERARAEEENVEVPKSDEDAQSRLNDRSPSREELDANIKGEGRRVDGVPEFNAKDLIDAFTGNDGRRPRIDDSRDNRVVLDFGNRMIVRGDDRPRLRLNARETYYEELPRGRSREVIQRPNGVRIVTIYNRYGDIMQRTRIDNDGREYLMIYAAETDNDPRPPLYDVGLDLPPMHLRVPVRDYIIDTSSEPDRDYYDFLAEPPVEQVERTYSIDEVRNSARIRDKVRRIDLDTITFASGSAEVPMSEANTLRKVADAMLQVIKKDPGETFFIEGHTDAVGGNEPNLVLSDERAASVASLLTEVYEIPAENLVTQGYGERFLKVRTEEAEQQNRRVTVRRVTPLVRPVVQN